MASEATTASSLADRLVIGAKIRIGPEYADYTQMFQPGQVIELVDGSFEYDNGLYTEYQSAPSWWDDEEQDYHSIWHLFENDLRNFMDCEVL